MGIVLILQNLGIYLRDPQNFLAHTLRIAALEIAYKRKDNFKCIQTNSASLDLVNILL